MKTAHNDIDTSSAVVIGNGIGVMGGGDIDFDGHQVGGIVEIYRFDMFIDDFGFVVGIEVASQGGKTQRGEKRILDGAPVFSFGLCQCRQDEFDFRGDYSPSILKKVFNTRPFRIFTVF